MVNIQKAGKIWKEYEENDRALVETSILKRALSVRPYLHHNPAKFNRPWDFLLKDVPTALIPRAPIEPQVIAAQSMLNGGARLFERWEYYLRVNHQLLDVVSQCFEYSGTCLTGVSFSKQIR